jgi:hypothetical protein
MGANHQCAQNYFMCVCAKSKAPPLPAVALQGEVVEWVSKFKYLGTLVCSFRDILVEV